jgi:hypothetical protein
LAVGQGLFSDFAALVLVVEVVVVVVVSSIPGSHIKSI